MSLMMAAEVEEKVWSSEQQRWARYYAGRLPHQLRQVTAFATARQAQPDALRPHFESFLTLLDAASARPELSSLWLDLVGALHPFPIRWGFWSPWLAVLQQAASKAAALNRPALQAKYLAHTAALLSDTALTETALATAREALDCARLAGDAWPLALAGSKVVAALRGLGRYDEAQDTLASVEEAVNSAVSSGATHDAQGRALLQMEGMDLMRHFGRLPEALALGEELVTALEAIPDLNSHELATALRRRSTILWAAGQYPAAVADLTRSAELFRQADDPLAAVFSEGNLGIVYFSMGRLDLAEAIKARAVRAAEELNAGWWFVHDIGELSGIYMYRGQLETALTYCQRHVDLAQLYNNERQLAQARNNRGVTLMLLNRHDEARPDIEDSLTYFRDEGIIESTVSATLDMALFLRATDEWERATALAEEGFVQANRLDSPILRILTTRCLALFRPPAEQKRLLREALDMAEAHERRMDVAGCLFSLAALENDAAGRVRLYDQAAAMLREMDAEAWLAGHSVVDPPLLPMFY